MPPDERVNSPQRQPQSPLATREPLTSTRDQSESNDTKNEILDLIYHHSDFTVSSIVDNPKVKNHVVRNVCSNLNFVNMHSAIKKTQQMLEDFISPKRQYENSEFYLQICFS